MDEKTMKTLLKFLKRRRDINYMFTQLSTLCTRVYLHNVMFIYAAFSRIIVGIIEFTIKNNKKLEKL